MVFVVPLTPQDDFDGTQYHCLHIRRLEWLYVAEKKNTE